MQLSQQVLQRGRAVTEREAEILAIREAHDSALATISDQRFPFFFYEQFQN
jgi:hypothetical protein